MPELSGDRRRRVGSKRFVCDPISAGKAEAPVCWGRPLVCDIICLEKKLCQQFFAHPKKMKTKEKKRCSVHL
jgi:hypothetical protein